jgi:hypothetical protein
MTQVCSVYSQLLHFFHYDRLQHVLAQAQVRNQLL